MSLGPTYVRADDDNFYKDASIKGKDFFICFDEDDPPELVIMKKDRSEKELVTRAEEILKNLHITGTIEKNNETLGYNSERCFSTENPLDFQPAFSTFLNITKPIPVISMSAHEGLYKGEGEGAFECFEEMDFPAWRKLKFGDKKE